MQLAFSLSELQIIDYTPLVIMHLAFSLNGLQIRDYTPLVIMHLAFSLLETLIAVFINCLMLQIHI